MPPSVRLGLSRRALLAAAGGAALVPRIAASIPARQSATPVADGATPTPPEPARDGGTLVVGALVEPATLHPWFADAAGFDVLEGVVEGLVRYNAAGRLQLALADDFAIASDDMTYAFTLRQGVRFHDGADLTSADVVASWQGQRDAGTAGPGSLAWAKIASIDAPDPQTVVVRTSEPYAPFLSTVAVAPVLPADVLASADADASLAGAPVGTGPFRVERWEPARAIELSRFDEYWGGAAHLDRITIRLAPDARAILTGLETGEVHVSGGALGLPAIDGQAAAGIPGVVVREHPTPNWLHLDLKQVGFLRERAVRQALDFATPREAIVADVLGGRAIPAFADQMPESWAFHPTLRPRPFDPERAADLLADAGLQPGRDGVLARDGVPFRLELWGVAGDPQAEAILTAVASAWSALGIAIRLRVAEPEQLWGPLGYQFSDAMTACLFAWTNGNDPDDLFYWHSSQIPTSPTAPGGNLPAFFNPYAFQDEIDALTARGASTLDLDERRDIYHQIQELLAREIPAIFLAWETAYPARRAEVGHFDPSPWTGLLWNAGEWSLDGGGSATPGPTESATPVAR